MPMRRNTPMPSLEGAVKWINGEPLAEDLKNKVVLVHFWSVSCGICHDVIEQVNGWRDQYADQGLVMISVHHPRNPKEIDVEVVEKDAAGMGITQPCAIDSKHAIVNRFENQFVPAYYVFGRNGELRHFQAGDRGYDRIVTAIEKCLAEELAVVG